MTWISNDQDRESLLNVLPDLGQKFDLFYASFFDLPQLPAETVELCRLRLAQLHRCEAEWQRREIAVEERKRESLHQWNTDEQLTPAQRACIAFTEVYAMDASAITDELADAVKLHYGDSGLVALIQALGIFDGLTRMSLLWQLPVPDAAIGAEELT